MTLSDIKANGYTVVQGKVYNLKDFADFHPGGFGVIHTAIESPDPLSIFKEGHEDENFETFLKKLYVCDLGPETGSKEVNEWTNNKYRL